MHHKIEWLVVHDQTIAITAPIPIPPPLDDFDSFIIHNPIFLTINRSFIVSENILSKTATAL